MTDAAPEVSLEVTVEFEDVDSFRIANHSRLIAYLERARLRLLAMLGVALDGGGPAPVLYDLKLRFRRPARLLDRLVVTARVREAEEHRLALSYRIARDGETLVRASSVIAFVDLDRNELVPVPEALLTALRGEADEPDGAAEGRR